MSAAEEDISESDGGGGGEKEETREEAGDGQQISGGCGELCQDTSVWESRLWCETGCPASLGGFALRGGEEGQEWEGEAAFGGDASGGKIPASEVGFGWRDLDRLVEEEGDPPSKARWKLQYEGHKGAKGTGRSQSCPEDCV